MGTKSLDVPSYFRGYWAALDTVLNKLNSMTTEENITQDQMRRRVYGEVMSMRPKIPENFP